MTCSLCGGSLFFLGELGSTTWYRCRECGIEHSAPPEPEPEPEVTMPAPGILTHSPNTAMILGALLSGGDVKGLAGRLAEKQEEAE